MEDTTGQLIGDDDLSNSELGGNESSEQVNATDAIDGFVEGMNDGIDGIDGINKVLMEFDEFDEFGK